MLFSAEWLEELLGSAVEPERMAERLTARGLTVDEVVRNDDEVALDVDVPANRPDCLGHLGLARELAAALDLTPPAPHPTPPAETLDFEIRIDEPDLCSRYTGRVVRGVRVGPSPPALVRRLERCGLRSVSNVVDISNLVMLETGNPLHFFDLDRVRGGRILVRRARDGSSFTTLDGIERSLDGDTLMIEDGEGPVALAGLMGGQESEIRDDTRDVLIEVAHFSPLSIRRTARRLGLHTDASHRFERGVDPRALERAQELAVGWLVEHAGGTAVPGQAEALGTEAAAPPLTLHAAEIQRLLGYRPDDDEIEASLAALQLSPARMHGDAAWTVTPPSWRIDLEREADLVEEVARHQGYDRIPNRGGAVGPIPPQGALVEARARRESEVQLETARLMAARGFHEAYGYAMIAAGDDDPFVPADAAAALPLDNPLAETMSHLRRSILPGLLAAVDMNQRRGVRDLRLFEIGRVFHDAGRDLPDEPLQLAAVWSGAARPRHWSGDVDDVTVADAAGLLESVLTLVQPSLALSAERCALPGLHPGRALQWRDGDGRIVGCVGPLHPGQAGRFAEPPIVAEVRLSGAVCEPRATPRYRPLPRLGSVERDLAVVLDGSVPFATVVQSLAEVPSPADARFDAVDRYAGPPLPDGSFSLTIRVTLQPRDRALTEDEIETYRLALVDRLRDRLGLELRS